jgi:hypothetical protein
MRLLAFAPALAGASFSAALSAAPFLSIGQDSQLVLTGSVAARYDDNVFLNRTGREADFVGIFAPGFVFRYDGGLTQSSVTYAHEFWRYADNSNLNVGLSDLSGSVVHRGARLKLDADAFLREFSQNSLTTQRPDQLERRRQIRADVGSEFTMSPKTRFAGSLIYDYVDYKDRRFRDSRSLFLPFDAYYALTPKVDVSLGYRYRRLKVEGGFSDSDNHFANVGIRGNFTPKLSGQLRAGYNYRDYDRGDSDSQLGIGASLNYLYSPKLVLRAAVSNDFNDSATGDPLKLLQVSLSGSYTISDSLSIGSTISHAHSDYNSGREERFYVWQTNATHVISSRLSVQATYLFRTNSANIPLLNFDNNVFSVSASIRY